MIWDEDANVFKGIIYEIERPEDANSDSVEYCIFSDADEGDEMISGEHLHRWHITAYLKVKFVTKRGKVGEYAMKKEVIKVDSENLSPAQGRTSLRAQGRPLVKAMLRGL
jgi:hypothetical protein